MEIIVYTPDWKERWDAFVAESNNGTMFHTQRFLDYHPPGKFSFHHLLFLEKGHIFGVLPGGIADGYFESPVGASYGSIVTQDLRFDKALEMVDTLIEYGKKQNLKGFLLTSAPMIYERYPNQNLDFALLWRGFQYNLHYISSAVPLEPERDILQKFSQTIRRNVRKTFKNPHLRVEQSRDYDKFYPILLDNKGKHDVKPTHSLEDLYLLEELMPECLELFLIYYKDKPIAGSLLFLPNKVVSLCFYNMLYYEYQHLKPIQRIMYEVVKWSTEQGYKYVDIGVSQDTKADNPMTPSMSLIEFKEKFDAKTIMRNTLKFDF